MTLRVLYQLFVVAFYIYITLYLYRINLCHKQSKANFAWGLYLMGLMLILLEILIWVPA